MKVNISKNYYPLDIKKCEEYFKAKYIGDFQVKNYNDEWSSMPVAVFYCAKPDISKNHKHYIGLFLPIITTDPVQLGPLSVTDATSAVKEPFIGIQADNGEIVISCYTHDYRTSTDGSVNIDGGREYTKCNNTERLIKIQLIKNKFVKYD